MTDYWKSTLKPKLDMIIKEVYRKAKNKGLFYWLVVVVLIILGIPVGHWLEGQRFAIQLRYKLTQLITQRFSPHRAIVQRTVLVLIQDEEFWTGEPARRTPIKRDYLAKLVRALDAANPAVIAVDFDLRSQMPDGTIIEHQDYRNETQEFLETIRDVSQRRSIILPKTVRFTDGYYVTESDIYDNFDFQNRKVLRGYIALPFDYRKVPLNLTTKDGAVIDSFSQAIVRAVNERALEPVSQENEVLYGSYLPSDSFTKLSGADILIPNDEIKKKLSHNIVIIGAGWNARAYGRGGMVDVHLTPVGPLQGPLIHANFVEALLDQRTAKPWGEKFLIVIEAISSFSVALIFALVERLHWKLLSMVILLIALVFFSYLSWLNLGLFYDFFVPAVLVAGHSIYEQVHEWQSGHH